MDEELQSLGFGLMRNSTTLLEAEHKLYHPDMLSDISIEGSEDLVVFDDYSRLQTWFKQRYLVIEKVCTLWVGAQVAVFTEEEDGELVIVHGKLLEMHKNYADQVCGIVITTAEMGMKRVGSGWIREILNIDEQVELKLGSGQMALRDENGDCEVFRPPKNETDQQWNRREFLKHKFSSFIEEGIFQFRSWEGDRVDIYSQHEEMTTVFITKVSIETFEDRPKPDHIIYAGLVSSIDRNNEKIVNNDPQMLREISFRLEEITRAIHADSGTVWYGVDLTQIGENDCQGWYDKAIVMGELGIHWNACVAYKES